MERLREVKALLKRWEAAFLRERRRKPGQADIEEAPEDTRRLYKEYKMLKQQRDGLDPARLGPSCHPAAQEPPAAEQVPDSGSWGTHLNRQPKAPGPGQGGRAVPTASAQLYGMRLKAKLGAASKETPLTPRRTPIPRRTLTPPDLPPDAKAPAPAEPPRGEEEEAVNLLLPPSVAGLAPIILPGALKPPPVPPAHQFQQLKQRVAQRLGALDPGWLQRCQGTCGGKEGTAVGDTVAEGGEDGQAPAGQEGGVRGTLVRDSRRKRPRGDEPVAVAKLWRSEEEEEEEEQVAKSRKAPEPPENILGEPEEEEKSRATPRARAPRQSAGNFVRLNLRRKSYVRGPALRGRRLRQQVWKQKWRKKVKSSWSFAQSDAQGPRVCQWESNHSDEEEEEEEVSLPTLEEAAHQPSAATPELCESRSTDWEPSKAALEMPASPGVWRPPDEPPTPPAPVEPFYCPGKVQGTPVEVVKALQALGYSSFRPGQEVAIMRILSGLSTLVVLSTGMGKSLCYQLPAYLYHKRSKCITLVVSPLVSLMDDQVSGLPPCLKAVCVHSNMTKTQREAAMEKVQGGEAQVLLLSPEALVGGSGWGGGCLPAATRLPPVAFACIDEAHCLSEWSHNFRPCYLRLCKVLRDRLGVRCFLGLTATATTATARDVAQHLGIPPEEGVTVHSAAVPPNLRLSVSTDSDRDQALISLLQGERFGSLDSIIVYCTRREETVRVAALLRTCLQGTPLQGAEGLGHQQTKVQSGCWPPTWIADAYHAGLSPVERRRVQKSFMSGRLRLVVATVAFGMGLDKPDVRGVIHYNMPKNFESYVQEIGRAGRDGEPAHCHLFLDPKGGDLHELRRHIYGDTVDFFAVKMLVRKVFAPCKCLELQQKHQDMVKEETEVMEEEDGGGTAGLSGQRVCYKHERAIPIQPTVESLDMREEGIETLLCYLELHPCRWLELLPPTYSSCRLHCYGGPRQLQAVAQSSPPVAIFLARERLAGRSHDHSSSVEFDVVALSDSMGWEAALVKRALRQLQWDPRLHQGGRSKGKSGVVVEFGDLSFHLRTYGDLSDEELDSVCDFLHRRVVAREKAALGQLRACFQSFQSVAFQTWGPHPEEEEEERSCRLKALLSAYFELEPTSPEEEEEKEEEDLSDAELRESQVRDDVRHFLTIRHDEKFTGRAVARIFHGIGSPCFPAQIYGRDRRFWRKHLSFDFHRLARLATEEILASR